MIDQSFTAVESKVSNLSSFVFQVPPTFTYSQDRIAKKKAPMNRSQRALSYFVVASSMNLCNTEAVTATCGFGGGSCTE
jgi:hypothetical protein